MGRPFGSEPGGFPCKRQRAHSSRISTFPGLPTSVRILLANLLQSSKSTFFGEVSPAFLPSKQVCWTHKFRHLGVGQQYPPVICDRPETPALKPVLVSNNPCQESVSAWLLVRMFFDMPHAASLLLEREYAVADPGGRCWWRLARVPHASSPPPARCPAHPLTEGSVWVSSPVPSPVSSIYSQYW